MLTGWVTFDKSYNLENLRSSAEKWDRQCEPCTMIKRIKPYNVYTAPGSYYYD